jgi:hypothetical protein
MCLEFSFALYVEACEDNTEAEIDQLAIGFTSPTRRAATR